MENFYTSCIDPDIVKDPILLIVQESSNSEGSSVEKYSAFYVISLPSPWVPVIYDSLGYVVREDKPIVTYGGNLIVAVYTCNQYTTMTIWKQ